jgi:hypothetical protein
LRDGRPSTGTSDTPRDASRQPQPAQPEPRRSAAVSLRPPIVPIAADTVSLSRVWTHRNEVVLAARAWMDSVRVEGGSELILLSQECSDAQ